MKFSRSSKEYDIQDRLKHKRVFCISKEWIKWAKKYSSRAFRRKHKQKLKELKEE